jgi:hypothetical protein
MHVIEMAVLIQMWRVEYERCSEEHVGATPGRCGVTITVPGESTIDESTFHVDISLSLPFRLCEEQLLGTLERQPDKCPAFLRQRLIQGRVSVYALNGNAQFNPSDHELFRLTPFGL